MPAKKNEPANTKAKAAAPKASKADTSKAEAKKPAAAKTTAKAAAPARPRAVARPVTRTVAPKPERAARPEPEDKREKREVAPAKTLPTAPAGHAPLIAADGSASGSIELPSVFTNVKNNVATLFQAFLASRANARQATSATKNRSRVAGGGAKPWRQKGTGRARQGSTRSPHWRHGGVVFGPNGRQYWQRIPAKMRRAAFADAVGARAAQGRVLVVDGVKFNGDGERPKTRDVAAWLGKVGDTGSTVFVWNEIDEGAARAMANLPELELRTPGSLRLVDVLESDTLLVMRPALDALVLRANAEAVHGHKRTSATSEAVTT